MTFKYMQVTVLLFVLNKSEHIYFRVSLKGTVMKLIMQKKMMKSLSSLMRIVLN